MNSSLYFPLCLLIVAACALPKAEPLDIPDQIAQSIPIDIDFSEVNRDPDGCYFYVYAGDLFTVEDTNGDPVCDPEGEVQ